MRPSQLMRHSRGRSQCHHAQTPAQSAASRQPLITACLPPTFSAATTRTAAAARRAVAVQATTTRFFHDYAASPSDEGVLKLPARAELDPTMITHVFGYPRNMLERYHIGAVIGAGSFGVVRECMDIASGVKWAVKTISKTPKRGKPSPRYLLKLRNEVEIMQQLGFSLDAVTLRDIFEDDENIHLVMELCVGGALLERIESRSYSESYIASLIRSVLRFISQCHAKGIIYRDVKPDNFLFLNQADDSNLRATDFGLSVRHWPDQDKLFSRSGTPAYMAPELVLQKYDCKADVWSVGMLSYQLLTGKFPFWADVRTATLTDVWQAILYDRLDWQAEELKPLSSKAIDFLRSLLRRDPLLRPTAQQALQDPWLQEQGPGGSRPLGGSVVQRLQRFSTYGRLKQLALKMIVDHFHSGEGAADDGFAGAASVASLEELFARLDTDSSGGISLEELTNGLKAQGYRLESSELDHLVQGIDLNKDKNIQLPEFITTMLDWDIFQAKHNWEALLDQVFAKLDKNGDGCIDLEELTELLRNSISNKEVWDVREQLAVAKQMLREADINCDGHISREEFYELMLVDHVPDNLSVYDDRLGPPDAQAK